MVKTISLGGEWRFSQCGKEGTYPAKVPGTVCTDLLANGLMQDPYYRDNEAKTLEILHNDFTYSRTFSLEQQELEHEHVQLVFHGLDTIAEVFLNDHPVLSADNMHRRWVVDVKEYLHPGDNTIRVLFASARLLLKSSTRSIRSM